MKTPTTPLSIAMMNRPNAINREFLISKGWELIMDKPLFEVYRHTKSPTTLECCIGMYGEFYLIETNYLDGKADRQFTTINAALTQQDYITIVSLLGIKELM